jgi:hypothetical protein
MNTLRSILLGLTVLLMAASTQAQQYGAKADIPFDFVVGDHVYPAGEYILKGASSLNTVLRITNADGDSSRFTPTNTCSLSHPSQETKLVFRRMGDTLYLSQLWIAGSDTGREFPKGRAETLLAKNHQQEETVIVAAQLSR